MALQATLISQQIDLLANRNMIFDLERSEVEKILLDIGYYRLGFYWFHFEENHSTHLLSNDTKFSDVIELYYFDYNLRFILYKYLSFIELNFKTKLIYYFSNEYKDSPWWYTYEAFIYLCNGTTNSNCFKLPKFVHRKNLNKKTYPVIKKHFKKYNNHKFAPAWKAIEFFTFGQIINLYLYAYNKQLKETIANCYKIKSTSKFIEYLKSLNFLRNKCAHNEVIYDLKLSKGISKIPTIPFINDDRHSIIAIIQLVFYFLEQININYKEYLKSELQSILNQIRSQKVLDLLKQLNLIYLQIL